MMKKVQKNKAKAVKKEVKKKNKENSVFLVLGYILSIFFVIIGIAMVAGDLNNTMGVISGILYAVAGIVIFPKVKLKYWLKGLLFLLFIIIAEII